MKEIKEKLTLYVQIKPETKVGLMIESAIRGVSLADLIEELSKPVADKHRNISRSKIYHI